MAYHGALLAFNGSVTLTYIVEDHPGGPPSGWLALYQRQAGAGIEGFPIGRQALVEEVDLAGSYAEYVRGDWAFVQGSAPDWDASLPFQRLSWRQDEIWFSLSYHAASPETQGGSYITGDDLMAIASSLVDLGLAMPTETNLVGYIDRQVGECLVYVERRGAPIPSEAAETGKQASGCRLIFLGRPLKLSQEGLRLPFAETDLDADGRVERLEIVAQPSAAGENLQLEVQLLTPSRSGLYLTRWRYPIVEDYVRLEVLPCIGCEQLLAISSGSSQDYVQLLFRWNGQKMIPVSGSSSP